MIAMTEPTKKVNVAGLSLTEEDIEAMKQGVSYSGSQSGGVSYEGATVLTPSTSHPISGQLKDIRPNFAGNTPGKDGLVNNVSPSFAGRLAGQAQAFAKTELQRLEADAQAKESLTNKALRRDLEALRRQVKRLEKALKEVKANAEAT